HLGRVKREPLRRMLVTDWSQRIEEIDKNSTGSTKPLPLWGSLGGNPIANPAQVKEISSGHFGRAWSVRYEIDLRKLRKRAPNMIFKADIGVEGDGFLPVSVPLPPALVAKTAATPLP